MCTTRNTSRSVLVLVRNATEADADQDGLNNEERKSQEPCGAIVVESMAVTVTLPYRGQGIVIHHTPLIALDLTGGEHAAYAKFAKDAIERILEDEATPDPDFRDLKRLIHAIPVAWVRRRGGNHADNPQALSPHLAAQASERVRVIVVSPPITPDDILIVPSPDAEEQPATRRERQVVETTDMDDATFQKEDKRR